MDTALIPTDPSLQDGKWFKVEELRCHPPDNSPYPVEFADRLPTLMAMLDAIREAYGAAILVISGYRSPAYNQGLVDRDQASGSHQVASGSMHIQGYACDLRPASGAQDTALLWRVVKQLVLDGKLDMLGGYAYYPHSGWVHVDCRPKGPDGHVATWAGY